MQVMTISDLLFFLFLFGDYFNSNYDHVDVNDSDEELDMASMVTTPEGS